VRGILAYERMFGKDKTEYKDLFLKDSKKRFPNATKIGERFFYTLTKDGEEVIETFEVKEISGDTVRLQAVKRMEIIAILDFGSQYTQLIRLRFEEMGARSRIFKHDTSFFEMLAHGYEPKGFVLSGGPYSVYAKGHPEPDPTIWLAAGGSKVKKRASF